jgi:transposase
MNQTQLIIQMHKNEISIKKISKTLNISEREVYECLFQNGYSHFKNEKIERDKLVCEKYQNKISITEISKELKIDRHTVTDILNRYQIYRGNRNAKNTSNEKQQRNQKVIEFYKSGLSYRQISNKMNISFSTVGKILHDCNIDTRPQHCKGHSKGTTRNRKYFFDLNFFEKIDTEEKAYWLGFLMADGYVAYKGVISLALQEKDFNHIELFKKSINCENIPIIYNKKTKSYRINISSIKMAEDLIKLGCIQKKSLILKFPNYNKIPKQLIHHFMRGYFDGDGCIYIGKSPCFSVLGTPEFLNVYERILLDNIIELKKTKRIHRNNWNKQTEKISYSGINKVSKIYSFLYNNATIYLYRKKEKFDIMNRRLRKKS